MAKFNKSKLIGERPTEPLEEPPFKQSKRIDEPPAELIPIRPSGRISEEPEELPPSTRAQTGRQLDHATEIIQDTGRRIILSGETVDEFTNPRFLLAIIERGGLKPGPKFLGAAEISELDGQAQVVNRYGGITIIRDGIEEGRLTADAFGELLTRELPGRKPDTTIPVIRKERPIEPLPFNIPKSPKIEIINDRLALVGKEGGRIITLQDSELDKLLELSGLDLATLQRTHYEYPEPAATQQITRKRFRGSPLAVWGVAIVAAIVGVILNETTQPPKTAPVEVTTVKATVAPEATATKPLPQGPSVEVGGGTFTKREMALYNLLVMLDSVGISTPQSPKREVRKAEIPAPEERHTVPPVRTQVEKIRKQAKDERKKVEPPKKPRVESPEQLRKRCNDHSKNGWEEACRKLLRMQR